MSLNLKAYTRNFILIAILYIVLKICIQVGILNNYYVGILIMLCINIILTVSLNLTTGFLGQLALGHAGFMAIGAYSSAIFTKSVGLNNFLAFTIAIVIAGLIALIVAIIIGVPIFRLRGDYLAIITLGFGEIIKNIIMNLNVTGGSKGYFFIPKYTGFSNTFWVTVLSVAIMYMLIKSRHGRAIVSIREDEIAAESSGINVGYYKALAFAVAAFFAGIAGALYANYITVIKPANFGYEHSIEIIIMVVLGGMGSITGSILAAVILTILPQLLSSYESYRMLIYSVLLIAIMIFKPSGLLGVSEFSMDNFVGICKSKIKSKGLIK
jgi:branched-chain amino acid transport system permease protein